VEDYESCVHFKFLKKTQSKGFDIVQAWIDNVAYSHSDSADTAYNYKRSLEVFCGFIGKSPQEILQEYEGMRDREFRRKYAEYVRALISHLSRTGYCVGSVRAVISAIKSFFKYNDLPLGHVPMARKKITFHNRDINRDEIVKILQVSRPRDRAFYCMSAQAGLGPGRLCSLRLKHVSELRKGTIPCKVDVPEEIAKGEFGSYFTFMGEESVRYLKAYLATRPRIGAEDYLFTCYGSEKRASRQSFTLIFGRTVNKLKRKGLIHLEEGEHGKPGEVRLYNLRKFFRKHAGQAGIEYVNFWMGHKTNYKAPHIPSSDVHYFSREDVEFQRKLYAEKAMPFLRLEAVTPSEMDKIIQRQGQEIEDLRRQVKKLQKIGEDPLIRNIERLSQLPGGREFFASMVEDAKAKLAETVILPEEFLEWRKRRGKRGTSLAELVEEFKEYQREEDSH